MPIKQVHNVGNVPVKIWTNDVDEATINQLINTTKLPFIHKHVAAMPDTHLSKGSTVGSVIPTKNAIIPAAVGVDIGCGMLAVRLSLTADQLPTSLRKTRLAIEKGVPLGAGGAHRITKTNDVSDRLAPHLLKKLNEITSKHPNIAKDPAQKAASQMGTLGSGNHFIELCLDESDHVWIMLHSGSRGIGNCIGSYFIDKAKKEMQRWHIDLPDKDLAYLPAGTTLFEDYVEAVSWAQDYAAINRNVMLHAVFKALWESQDIPAFSVIDEIINCHHNYVELENHFGQNVYVTRKGAIRAREGDTGIIPGARGAKSFIVRGKGNKESFCSCSHGAGRRLSRAKAKQQYTVEDLREQSAGVECEINAALVDEIRDAYKPIETVMDNQTDLVEINHTLRAIVNIKGS